MPERPQVDLLEDDTSECRGLRFMSRYVIYTLLLAFGPCSHGSSVCVSTSAEHFWGNAGKPSQSLFLGHVNFLRLRIPVPLAKQVLNYSPIK